MWYEALIPLGIVGVAMSLPPLFNYWSNYWAFGNHYMRNLDQLYQIDQMIRDNRITGGKHWATRGLEAIPDK